MNGNLIISENIDALCEALFALWQRRAQEAISRHGKFHVALSGGSTPKTFYAHLAAAGQALPWADTCIYFGDERSVPPDHDDSNFKMARDALLSKVPIPKSQVHAMVDPGCTPQQNAVHYMQLLAERLPCNAQGLPVFDLILLGMGDDGHTASLFPDTELLVETEATVGANYVDKLHTWRISLTYPAINAAQQIAIIVAGAGKADMMQSIAATPGAEIRYPIHGVNPQGRLDWYLDKAAAAKLGTTS